MGKSQRRKGVTGELEIAHIFQEAGFRARRGVGQWQAATTCPDVILDDLPQYWIEVKRGAQTRPLEALGQAAKACGSKTPIAICRNDGGAHTVAMSLPEWMALNGAVVFPISSLLVNVIMPLHNFMRIFEKKHADKNQQIPLIEDGSSDTMATSVERTIANEQHSEQVRNNIPSQPNLFIQPDKTGPG